jgi:hypothetical protein
MLVRGSVTRLSGGDEGDLRAGERQATRIIPGHGEVATKADLAKPDRHARRRDRRGRCTHQGGDTLEKTVAARPLKPWSGFAWSFISEDSFTRTLYNGLKK